MWCHFLVYMTFAIFSLDFVLGFNFDVENPIIIKNSLQPSSQFGATVTFVTESLSWIIIGAPRGETDLFNQTGIDEPGVLWRCSLGESVETCEILETDDHGNVEQDYHDKGKKVHHRKDGGRLGETAFVGESDRFVTCAPKWSNQRAEIHAAATNASRSHYFMNGICYWRPKAQIVQKNIPTLLPNHTLIPLRNQDRQGGSQNSNDGEANLDWVFGEAGFSIHLLKSNEMILGAPGVNEWRGSVIRLSDSLGAPLNRNGGTNVFGKVFRSPQLVSRPELDSRLNSTKSTYFGYAVTAGNYFPTSESTATQFASGAPRGGLTQTLIGHVIIFRFPESDKEPLHKLQEIEGPLGTGIGSYFGSVLCSMDLNNDGFDDLLIGAPRFSSSKQLWHPSDHPATSAEALTRTIQRKPDFTGYGDEGAVFVYMSDGRQMGSNPIQISGSNKPWSHFGSAISSIGDINHDGYNDVAISAPQEDSRRGAVYIYHGQLGIPGLKTKYSQVIYAKELDSSLMGFGHSLSLGIDIDRNNYNDLAVGAFSSSHAVILRSRPVVTISGNITSSMSKINLTTSEFSFVSCVSYTGYMSPSSLTIQVHLYSDADTKLGRVHIRLPGSTQTNQSYVYNEVTGLRDGKCQRFEAEVKRSLTLSQGAVVIRQEVYLEDEMKSKSKNSRMLEIKPGGFGSGSGSRVDLTGPEFNAFCKTCPKRDLSKSNYASLSLPLGVACGADNVCVARLKVDATFKDISEDTFIMGTAKSLVLHIVATNSEETAISPRVRVSWTKRNLVSLPPNCGYEAAHNLSCDLGQILRSVGGEEKLLNLEFEMNDLVAGDQNTLDEFVITIEATTLSDVVEVARVDKRLQIKAKADIGVSGEQTTVPFYETNPAQIFTHTYNISLEGPTTLSRVDLVFEVPLSIMSISETERFVSITSISAKHDGEDFNCRAISNDLPLTLNMDSTLTGNFDPDLDGIDDDSSGAEQIGKDLRKRELGGGQIKTRNKRKADATGGLTVKSGNIELDCADNKLVHCAHVTCLIATFRPDTLATVKISMKVSTEDIRKLMEKYSGEGVRIRSRGKVINLKKDIQPFPHNPDSYDCSTTISTAIDKTPAWVIPASIGGTILFLLMLAFCLWAMGVFDRKKRIEETEPTGPESIALNAKGIEDDEEIVDEVFTRNSYEQR